METQEIILVIAGVFNLTSAMITNTRNWRSALWFKVFPFFIGLACLYVVFVP